MAKKLVIIGALANAGIDNNDKVLADFLKENVNEIEIHRINYGPGPIMALEWQMIIDSMSLLANIATFAGALWAAYEKFIVTSKKGNARIFIQLKNEEGEFAQFSIGTQYKDKDVFIKTFVNDVKNITVDSKTIKIEKKSTTTIQIKENKDRD